MVAPRPVHRACARAQHPAPLLALRIAARGAKHQKTVPGHEWRRWHRHVSDRPHELAVRRLVHDLARHNHVQILNVAVVVQISAAAVALIGAYLLRRRCLSFASPLLGGGGGAVTSRLEVAREAAAEGDNDDDDDDDNEEEEERDEKDDAVCCDE